MKKVEVEVQYFDGCPNAEEFIGRVKASLKHVEGEYIYKETLVDSYEFAKRIKFRGSPTLLINGIDFENTEAPDDPGMNCRVYLNDLPTEEDILRRIRSVG